VILLGSKLFLPVFLDLARCICHGVRLGLR
jgi:hypothetical protein